MANTSRVVTIRDVAKVAGVSPATVSRTLNGHGSVDQDLAARVRRAVEQTGYVPNPTGRALRRRVSDSWAAIVPDIQNPFFTGVVAAFETVAIKHGYSVMLCNTDEKIDRERQYIAAAVSQQMAGVILAVDSEEESDLTPLLAADVPLVLVDRRVQGYCGDAVLVDNRMVGQLAAKHLAQQGYRRIACIAGPASVSTTEDRLTGFRDTLDRLGVGLPDRLVRRANLRFEGGEIALRSLLAAGDPPDAVFVTNGPITAGAFRAAQTLGLTIPEQLAIVGTDDDQWTRMVQPQVTVISQPVDRIGVLAGECLAARTIDQNGIGEPIVLKPTLLVRDSS